MRVAKGAALRPYCKHLAAKRPSALMPIPPGLINGLFGPILRIHFFGVAIQDASEFCCDISQYVVQAGRFSNAGSGLKTMCAGTSYNPLGYQTRSLA